MPPKVPNRVPGRLGVEADAADQLLLPRRSVAAVGADAGRTATVPRRRLRLVSLLTMPIFRHGISESQDFADAEGRDASSIEVDVVYPWGRREKIVGLSGQWCGHLISNIGEEAPALCCLTKVSRVGRDPTDATEEVGEFGGLSCPSTLGKVHDRISVRAGESQALQIQARVKLGPRVVEIIQ